MGYMYEFPELLVHVNLVCKLQCSRDFFQELGSFASVGQLDHKMSSNSQNVKIFKEFCDSWTIFPRELKPPAMESQQLLVFC